LEKETLAVAGVKSAPGSVAGVSAPEKCRVQ
jgi:hypothetical protein